MIQELNQVEMDDVDGGILFVPLLAAAFCTSVQVGVVAGIFDGIADSATK